MLTLILSLLLVGTCDPSSDIWSYSTDSFYLGNHGKYRGLVNSLACPGFSILSTGQKQQDDVYRRGSPFELFEVSNFVN